MDPGRPERIDGDGGDQRRVDASREPDHRIGEAVLPQVVPGPEHEGGVDLGVGGERLGQRWRRGDGSLGGPGLGDHQPGQFAIGPAGIRGRDGKIDHDQVRFELDPVGQQGPVAPP